MDAEQYMDRIKDALEKMEPKERVCASIMVKLGQVLVALVNQKDWQTIEEMRSVCKDMFVQAGQARTDPTIRVKVH